MHIVALVCRAQSLPSNLSASQTAVSKPRQRVQGIAHGNVKLRNMFLRVHSMPGGEAPVLKLGGFEHAKVDPFVNALAHPRRASSRGSSPSAAGRGSRSGSRSTSPGTVFTPRVRAVTYFNLTCHAPAAQTHQDSVRLHSKSKRNRAGI